MAVLGRMPYGLYVVGSKTSRGVATIIANWVGQISFEPKLISVSIESDSDMRHYIEGSNFFSINMLPDESLEFAKAFLKKSEVSGSVINGKQFLPAQNGTPFLKDAVASFECRVKNSVVAGDHVLFIGEVVHAVDNKPGNILTLASTGWKYNR
jgi:flavin reductase (DIM6/NTAB) family NADH-FMN oxidoreductase RutF